MNKLAGFGTTLFSTMICFIVYKLLIHNETDVQIIKEGTFFIILYGTPFIILGTLLSVLLDVFKKTSLGMYILLGFFMSIVVVLVFRLFHSLELTMFLVTICIIGAVSLKLGSRIKNKIIVFLFAVVVPFVFIMYIIFI